MAEAPKTGGMNVDTKLVRQLADLLGKSGLSEIEVEDEGRRIRVARQFSAAPAAAAPAQTAAFAPPAVAATRAPAEESRADWRAHPGAIKSPMVGTVYLAAEPGADALVKEGDKVAEGDTVLIIEAMKVMNPIAAPRAGKVTKICVANEQPVEFDEVLAIIE